MAGTRTAPPAGATSSWSPGTAGDLLREVARHYTRAQRVVADCCGTTSTQCHLLVELGRSGALSQMELGQRLCLEKSWVSRAVDGMAQRGLVTRQPHPQDARSALVTLTAEGEARVAELNRTLDRHAAHILRALPDAERTQVEQALRIVLDALRDHPDAAACCVAMPSAPQAPAARCSAANPQPGEDSCC